jgi:hypothetical protein
MAAAQTLSQNFGTVEVVVGAMPYNRIFLWDCGGGQCNDNNIIYPWVPIAAYYGDDGGCDKETTERNVYAKLLKPPIVGHSIPYNVDIYNPAVSALEDSIVQSAYDTGILTVIYVSATEHHGDDCMHMILPVTDVVIPPGDWWYQLRRIMPIHHKVQIDWLTARLIDDQLILMRRDDRHRVTCPSWLAVIQAVPLLLSIE